MNYRQLGNTGIQVSEIGMGCWGIGSNAYGHIPDSVSISTLQAAVNQGVTFFDTADIYGNGHSEELVGRALKDVRHDVVIATKVGSIPHDGKDMPVALDPVHIRTSCDKSLKRLQTDYIDIYQLHSPPVSEELNEAICELNCLTWEGKVGVVGVSCKSPDDAIEVWELENSYMIDVIQVNYNMIDQRARDNGLLAKCAELGIGVIARTPLAFGFLTGDHIPDKHFCKPDHRANWSQEQINLWANSYELFKQIAVNHGITSTQLALGFCLSDAAVSTVIPGMMTPIEVLENTSRYKLTSSEISVIHSIYKANNFFIEE